jgi:hypothetical protein
MPELRLPPMPVFTAPPDVVAPPVPAPMVEPVDTAAPEPAAIAHPAPVETAPVAVPERVPAPIDPRPLAQLLDDPAASMASIAAAFLRADEKTRLDALASLTLSGRPAALLPTKVAGIDIGRALESAALHRRTAQFANLVGEALTLSPDVAARLVEDSGGEAIVAALRALDIDSELVLRIMLFLNPQIGVSVTRVFALSSLYDQLDRHVALQLVAGWQDLDPVDVATRPPRHVAATAVDGALRARSDTTAARLPDRAATRETGTHGR